MMSNTGNTGNTDIGLQGSRGAEMSDTDNGDLGQLVVQRLPRAMSASGLKLLVSRPEDWVLKYILKQDSFVQTVPMGIGSVFDAMAKGALCCRLYGDDGMVTIKDKSIRAQDVREAMIDMGLEVEGRDRDTCVRLGGDVYDHYVRTGALGSLCDALAEMEVASVRLEERLSVEVGGVPVIGYPDLWCTGSVSGRGVRVVLDWKTTGVMGSLGSGKGVSPRPGYSDQWSANGRWHRVSHKSLAYPKRIGGFRVGRGLGDWKDQVVLYDLMLGELYGQVDGLGIVHLSCGVGGDRVAQYGMAVDEDSRSAVRESFRAAWASLQSGVVPGISDLGKVLGPLLAPKVDIAESGKWEFKRSLG